MSNTSDALILSRPLYGANFGQAVGRFFRKYATFTGRASRSEFWWVRLFLVLHGSNGVTILGTLLLIIGHLQGGLLM